MNCTIWLDCTAIGQCARGHRAPEGRTTAAHWRHITMKIFILAYNGSDVQQYSKTQQRNITKLMIKMLYTVQFVLKRQHYTGFLISQL